MNETVIPFDQGADLLLSDQRGVYIPQDFAEYEGWQGISAEDRQILEAGPEHEWYWEAWASVLDSAYIDIANDARSDAPKTRYTLWQDGDLWAIREGTCLDCQTDEPCHEHSEEI